MKLIETNAIEINKETGANGRKYVDRLVLSRVRRQDHRLC